MAKIKYRYNPETCKYEPWYLKGKQLRRRAFIFVGVSFGLAMGGYIGYFMNYGSLQEIVLEKKNQTLKAEWQILEEQITHSYGELHDLTEKDDQNYRVILDSSPLQPSIREAGIGGSEKFDNAALAEYPTIRNNYIALQNLEHRIGVELQSFDELNRMLKERMAMWASRPAIQPISNKQLNQLHLTYGRRFHPIFHRYLDHKGLDFAAPKGTPVYATGDGKIAMAYFSGSYGNVIYLKHGYSYETRYAHLSAFAVKEGDHVKRGQVIGYVGNTGNSVASHLHYEVLYNGDHINPINFFQRDLSNKEYEKLIEVASQQNEVLD